MLQTSAKKAVNNVVMDSVGSPGFADTYSTFIRDLQTDSIPRWYRDSIFQLWREEITMDVAYCFGQIHTAIHSERAAIAVIPVGDSPSADKETKGNSRKLNTVNRRSYGKLNIDISVNQSRNRNGDCDGVITVAGDLPITTYKENRPVDLIARFDDSYSAPLEIGYTSPQTTLLHLKKSLALARWAYDQNQVVFFVLLPNGIDDMTLLRGFRPFQVI